MTQDRLDSYTYDIVWITVTGLCCVMVVLYVLCDTKTYVVCVSVRDRQACVVRYRLFHFSDKDSHDRKLGCQLLN